MKTIWNFLVEIFNAIFGGDTPKGGLWKCAMFAPARLCGTNNPVPWPTNRGVDSNQQYAAHPLAYENEKRINSFAWSKAYGADTAFLIAENLYGHSVPKLELQMFLTNRKSPVDGHQMNDGENFVVKARAYGIQRWIVSLINNPDSIIPRASRQDYVKQMCDCYSWATKDQVAFLVGLECDRNMGVDEVRAMVNFLKLYAGDKRIIVGSADAGFLKACSGNGVELWVECDPHPFDLVTMKQADEYIAKLKNLQRYGKVWAGEFRAGGSDEIDKYITQQAIKFGMDCGCGYFR